jgi:hypothetical protein
MVRSEAFQVAVLVSFAAGCGSAAALDPRDGGQDRSLVPDAGFNLAPVPDGPAPWDGPPPVDGFGAGFRLPDAGGEASNWGVTVRQIDGPVASTADLGLQVLVNVGGTETIFTAAWPSAATPTTDGAYLTAITGCGYGWDIGLITIWSGNGLGAPGLMLEMHSLGEVRGTLVHAQLPGGRCTFDYGHGEIVLTAPATTDILAPNGSQTLYVAVGRLDLVCRGDGGPAAYIGMLFNLPTRYGILACAKTSRSSRP